MSVESSRGSGLFVDFYELTMANGYFKVGLKNREASFYLSFREAPFSGGYALMCGLESALDHLERLSFSPEDIEFLAEQCGNDGAALFDPQFLQWLREFTFNCDVDAAPEGTIVFPGEPLVRVTGSIVACQLVETALLNAINFQTLVATKAARVCQAAHGDPVVEFGLRRAQGPDGGLSATRAAYVGGCSATSNTFAARNLGIPASGTHAHSWVMAFDEETAAFDAYAKAMPNNCTFLVDTYDTLRGVERAIEVGKRLRAQGHEMVGIRIDSGDLAWLSIKARSLLDAGGFESSLIVASNELDEYLIESLKEQGALIDVWGVGTKLVTAYDQPALGGVYKLSAIRDSSGAWQPRMKVSELLAKVSVPGVLGVRRYLADGRFAGDMVHDLSGAGEDSLVMVDPADPIRRKAFAPDVESIELLEPVLRAGARVGTPPTLAAIRQRAADQLIQLDPSITRFLNPHTYPVGLEQRLHEQRTQLVLTARGFDQSSKGG